MGYHFESVDFSSENLQRFNKRLEQQLASLKTLLQQPGWGEGPCTLGAELEVYLLDANGQPKLCNQELLDSAQDPCLTEELNQFNLEYNMPPVLCNSGAFQTIEQRLLSKLASLQKLAAHHQTKIAAIGILPTLRQEHFGLHSMTDRPRYHALTQVLKNLRKAPFQIDIHGPEVLNLAVDDLTLEGANTSFQFHYQASPQRFNQTYNTIQLITPLVLALATNSPYLLEK